MFGIIITRTNMFKKISLVCFIIVILFSVYMQNFSPVFQDIKNNKNINVLFIVQDSTNLQADNLRLILLQYNVKYKKVKILFIDDAITILQKKKKSKTLNEMFFEQDENKRTDFIKNEIESLFNGMLNINYYVFADTKSLYSFIKLFNEKEIINRLGSDYFLNAIGCQDYTASVIYQIKIIKYIINNLNRNTIVNIAKFLMKGDCCLKTNFKLSDVPVLYSKISDINVSNIRFADISTVYSKNRIEINQNELPKITDFLTKDYDAYNQVQKQNSIKAEVLNGSEKRRMAIKAVDLLRKNGFDIFEWGTSRKQYEFTIILDLAGNFKQSSKISGILNCGEIIFRPDTKLFSDITVILGKDCIIYDKLDRID